MMNNRKLVFSIIFLMSWIFFFLIPTQRAYAYFTDNKVVKSDIQLKTGNIRIDSKLDDLGSFALAVDNQTPLTKNIAVVSQGTLTAQVFYKVEIVGDNWQNYVNIQVNGVALTPDKVGKNQFIIKNNQPLVLDPKGQISIPVSVTKLKNQENSETTYQVKLTVGLIQSNIGEIQNKLIGFYDSQEKAFPVIVPKEPVKSNWPTDWPVTEPFDQNSKIGFRPLYYSKRADGTLETSVPGTIYIKYQKNQLKNIETVKTEIKNSFLNKEEYQVTQVEYVEGKGFILTYETNPNKKNERTGNVETVLQYDVLYSQGVFSYSEDPRPGGYIPYFGYKVLTRSDYLQNSTSTINESSKILTSESGTRITLGINKNTSYDKYTQIKFSELPNLTIKTSPDSNFSTSIDWEANELIIKQKSGITSVLNGELLVQSNGRTVIRRTIQSIPILKEDWWSSLATSGWSSLGNRNDLFLSDKSKNFTFNSDKKSTVTSPVLYFKATTGYPVKFSLSENKFFSVTKVAYSPDGQYLQVVLNYTAQDQYQTGLNYTLYAGDIIDGSNNLINNTYFSFTINTVSGTQALQQNSLKAPVTTIITPPVTESEGSQETTNDTPEETTNTTIDETQGEQPAETQNDTTQAPFEGSGEHPVTETSNDRVKRETPVGAPAKTESDPK